MQSVKTLSLSAVALSWIVTASASAKTPAGRYTTTADTIYDTKTKLTWERHDNGVTGDLPTVQQYCRSLNTTLPGAWRLPTVTEMMSILDYTIASYPMMAAEFSPAGGIWYWTSTPGLLGTANWVIDGWLGDVRQDGGGVCRCVKTGM